MSVLSWTEPFLRLRPGFHRQEVGRFRSPYVCARAERQPHISQMSAGPQSQQETFFVS